jgi:uncharacterized protein (DUF2147 family)
MDINFVQEDRTMKTIAVATAALIFAAPALAQTSPATQAPTAAPAKDPNRIICEREEEIGSRLGGKKVCKTAAEWQLERQQQRETLEGVQRQGTSTGVPAG